MTSYWQYGNGFRCGAWLALVALCIAGFAAAPALAQTDDELKRALETPIDEGLDETVVEEPVTPHDPEEKAPAENSADADAEGESSLGAIQGLDEGLAQAQIDGKPALVLVTGEACPWCHRLKAEMERSPAREALARWTFIEVDVDESPDSAKRLGVAALPALRLLRPSGSQVAAREGFLPAAKLVEWLDENYRSAAAEADEVLLAAGELDEVSIVQLIQHLEDRDPQVREAAIGRLSTVPQLAGGPLVESFSKGTLARRLATLEVLAQWGAPVDGVDPWRPTSISAERLARLQTWSDELATNEKVATDAALDDAALADAEAQIDRLLTLSVADGAAIAARLARHWQALLPEVYRRLEAAETDDAREKLLALRYRLVASDALVLRFPGGLGRLASRDATTRRQAAERLVGLATADDQPLLLELFSDPDPLIREIALRGLQQAGGEGATASLVRLLADPEPNVRAAVLKQLAEQESKSLVAEVAKYVETEQDADLLVHAIRYLRVAAGEPSAKALLPLLAHDAWQVRAESAEALHDLLDGEMEQANPALAADIYAALIQRLDDDDAFVVSRAIDALGRQASDVSIEPLLNTAEKHPELAPQILESVSHHGKTSPKVRERLRQFAKHEQASIRAAAVAGLHTATPETLAEWGPAALEDQDPSVRLAAASVIFEGLNDERRERQHELARDAAIDSEPLPELPEDSSPSLIQRALGALFPSEDADEEVEAEPAEAGDDDLFGEPADDERDPFDDGDSPKPPAEEDSEPAAEEPAEEVDEATVEPPDDGQWDRWLAGYYIGRGRPKYYDSIVEPLSQMLAADDPQERLAAALALVPLGRRDAALPVLRESVARDGELVSSAAAVLPWLTWEERRALFDELRPLAKSVEQRSHLVSALVEAVDARAAELLWGMLQGEGVDVEFASTVSEGLTAVYQGPDHYYGGETTPAVSRRVLAEARPHAQSGGELEALVALIQMAHVDPAAAATEAQAIAADDSRPQRLRDDAFHIALIAAPAAEQANLAQAALASGTPQRQQLALMVLVSSDDDQLNYVRDYSFYLPRNHDYSSVSTDGPIIPQPPEGIAADDVRPLLSHADAKTRAYAGYVLALFGEREGLEPLIEHWRDEGTERPGGLALLVTRAIAKQNASEQIDVLREIYAALDEYTVREFYWTIRIMSGEEVLRLRKEIRDKHGISNLR